MGDSNHAVMDQTTPMPMNHDHNMMTMTTAMNHAGHDMDMGSMTTAMNHVGHDMDMGSMTTAMNHAGHDMDMGDHSMGMDMPGMKMYFHTGYDEYILFEDLFTKSVGAMVGACFVIFAVAILYEGLKFLREVLLQRALSSRKHDTYRVNTYKAGSSQEQINPVIRNPSVVNRILSCDHIIQTVLHMFQVFISYCLMLVFMTYNVWLCVAIIAGAGVGYFLFGWKRAVVVDSNEHCH